MHLGLRLALVSALALALLALPLPAPSVAQAAPQLYSEGNAWYIPYGPQRILDTRVPGANRGSWQTLVDLPKSVAYQDISGWVANVTVTDTSTDGGAAVWGAAEASMDNIAGPPPNTSNLNWKAGQTVSALVPVFASAISRDGGKLVIQTLLPGMSNVDWVVDLVGYFAYQPATGDGLGRFTPIAPARIEDSRQGSAIPPGQDLIVPVAAHGGVPSAGLEAVALNVAVIAGPTPGWLSIDNADAPRPGTSSVNWGAGEIRSNAAYVAVGSTGAVRVHNGSSSPINVVIDAFGYFTDASTTSSQGMVFEPIFPNRITDTRTTGSPLATGEVRPYSFSSAGNVPASAGAVYANLTVVNGVSAGYLTIWPGGDCAAPPSASNVNWPSGEPRADPVTVGVTNGTACLFNSAEPSDLIVDLFGWFQ